MLVALSNVTGMQFIVFTTQDSHPVIHISPRKIKCGAPVYLAFSSTGCGHYDAVMKDSSLSQTTSPEVTKAKNQCNCGENAVDTGNTHCLPIVSKYGSTIRCPCLKNKKALCRCKNCDNDKQPITQKRRPHSHQIAIDKSAVFGRKEGEDMDLGNRSILEFFILEEVLSFINHHDLESDNETLHSLYNAIVDVVESLVQEDLPMGKKSITEIDVFSREHEHNLSAFTALCTAQVQIALSSIDESS